MNMQTATLNPGQLNALQQHIQQAAGLRQNSAPLVLTYGCFNSIQQQHQ